MSVTIATLEVGQPVEGVFAVRSKERRLSRQGTPFLAVTLADATGAVAGYVFDQADFFDGQFASGDRVRVAGQVISRGGRPAIRIRHLRSAADEVAAEDLLPRSHREPDELMGFAEVLTTEIADRNYQQVTQAVLTDRALADGWLSAPCTRSGHHAYRGGLIEHTVGVASLAQTLCQWHPRLNPDLLVAAAIIHDVGHIRAWRLGATFELTDEGRMLGHVTIGHELVDGIARRLRVPEAKRLALLHVMGWHHGPPTGQNPSGGSPEALALMRINGLETQIKSRLEGSGPVEDALA